MMDGKEIENKWREWVEKSIGGPPERINQALIAVLRTLASGGKQGDAVAAAQSQAQAWDRAYRERHSPKTDESNLPPNTPESSLGKNHFSEGSEELARQSSPSHESGGIMDIIEADKSAHGRSTLSAMKAIEMNVRLGSKAFFATRGFRGRYGFNSGSSSSGLLITILIIGVIVSIVIGQIVLFQVFLSLALFWLFFVLFITPLLAKRTQVSIGKGRLLITYGLFSTKQIPIEIHWIRQVTYSQSFMQKLLGECSIRLDVDSANRNTYCYKIPGIVLPAQASNFAEKLRNAAQKVRQGNYYAKGFVG